jgi:hypothetical protein
MPSPSQSDLHVNVPLTNVGIAWKQDSDAFICDRIFPKVPVKHQSNLYWKYSKSDWRRTDVRRRAPGTESPGVGWTYDTDSYFAHVYAVHKDIDDQVRANADSNFQLDKDATEFVTNQLLLKRDIDWNSTFFKSGVWSTDLAGGTDFTKWSQAGSDPIKDVAQWSLDFRKLTGFKPNKMVLGAEVLMHLLQHADIVDRIKYTQKGIVSEDLLATLFNVEQLYTSYATVGDGPNIPDADAQDAATTYDFISNTKGVLMAYAPSGPSLQTPSAGYTFTWNGYLGGNSEGLRIKRFRMEWIEADRVEGSMTYDMKVVAPDLGVFADDVV